GARVDPGPGPRDRDPLRAGRNRARGRGRAGAREEGGRGMKSPSELVERVEAYLDELALTPELGPLAEPMRYALAGGGKRIRPVLTLATGEALGRDPDELLPAGAAVELVHSFSLVHDDLPARDFADELGMLFQVVDDILDGDGFVLAQGEDGARRLAVEAAERAQARLAAIDADTSVLEEIVASLATRTG